MSGYSRKAAKAKAAEASATEVESKLQAQPEQDPEQKPSPGSEAKPAAPAAPERATPRIPGLSLVAGAGDLSPDLRWDTGAASALQMEPNLGYVGVDYNRTFAKPVSRSVLLGVNLHPTVLRTFTAGPTGGATTAQVLTTGGAMYVNGPLTLTAGAGIVTDLTAIGKPGAAVFMPVVAAGASYDAGPVALDAQAFAPIEHASDAWQLRTKVSFPRSRFMPSVAVVTAAYGVDRVEVSKSFRLSRHLDATVSVTENLASPGGRHLSAGAGLRWSF